MFKKPINLTSAAMSEGNSSFTERNMENQYRKPSGWLGRWLLRNMNQRHSGVTDWGLSHVSIPRDKAILDVGCGGGRTIAKLVAASGSGVVYGLDHSAESVRTASATNADLIQAGRVAIREGSVSQLPYNSGTFDLVTAVETHFFWPNLPADVREVLRVVKPGGTFAIIAEVYKGANALKSRMVEKHAPMTGMTLLTPDAHRALLRDTSFADVQVFTDPQKGWVCATGRKPL
ncbi:MAG: class I SAM-dependent methyltransferase [Terracidiphilus sp.]